MLAALAARIPESARSTDELARIAEKNPSRVAEPIHMSGNMIRATFEHRCHARPFRRDRRGASGRNMYRARSGDRNTVVSN